MNKFTFLIAFVILTRIGFAQSFKISGVILDPSLQPISGVNIYENNTGTISNEKGEFEFKSSTASHSLTFSHVGFKSVSIKASNGDYLHVKMEPSVITLPELIIGNDYAFTLVKNAIEKACIDTSKIFYAKAFYQKISKVGKKFTGLHEIFFDAGWTSFGITDWNVTNARYAKRESKYNFENITVLAFHYFGTLLKRANKNMPNRLGEISDVFVFRILNYLNPNTENEIVVIECTPKKGFEKDHFSGKIYIKESNFNIMKIEGNCKNLFKSSGNFYSEIKNPTLYLDLVFKENANATAVLNSAVFNLDMDLRQEKVINHKIEEHIKLLFYEYLDSKPEGIHPFESKDDLALIKNARYDSLFWINNATIKRTSVEKEFIKSFEKDEYFGNYSKSN